MFQTNYKARKVRIQSLFCFFIFLPEVKRPLLQKSTIIVNCLYLTPQQTTNNCLNEQNIALNLSLCLHQELVCFFVTVVSIHLKALDAITRLF